MVQRRMLDNEPVDAALVSERSYVSTDKALSIRQDMSLKGTCHTTRRRVLMVRCQHTKQLLPQKENCREPSSRSRNGRKSQKVAATVTGKNRCRHAAGKPLAMEVGEEQERKVVALKKEWRGEKKIEALISIPPDTEKCGM